MAAATNEAARDQGWYERKIWEDWFSSLTSEFERKNWKVLVTCEERADGNIIMRSTGNGQSFLAGRFRTPSLAELRAEVAELVHVDPGALTEMGVLGTRSSVHNIVGDVGNLHALPENIHSCFQAASQFNCLEFPSQNCSPEHGVTGYQRDKTQGPCCALACGPGTIFRNYFCQVPGNATVGQSSQHQLENLRELCLKIGNEPHGRYFEVMNGYTIGKQEGLVRMNTVLEAMDEAQRDEARCTLRVGLQEDTQVTSRGWGKYQLRDQSHLVTQIYGSACSVAYSRNNPRLWASFASLVLEASYEATVLTAVLNAYRHRGQQGSKKLFLTALGGGVFGNNMKWIAAAIKRAVGVLDNLNLGLEISIVTYHATPVPFEFKSLRRASSRAHGRNGTPGAAAEDAASQPGQGMDRLISEIVSQPAGASAGAAQLVKKILNNLVEHPGDQKYARVRLSGKPGQKLTAAPASIIALQELGFVASEDREFLAIDISVATRNGAAAPAIVAAQSHLATAMPAASPVAAGDFAVYMTYDPREAGAAGRTLGVVAFYYPGVNSACDNLCRAPFLGNFWSLLPETLSLDGHNFTNAEAAFQALKHWDHVTEFESATGEQAFQLKRQYYKFADRSYHGFGSNWAGMLAVLRAKFKSPGNFATQLLATGDSFLLEHNDREGRDKTWSNNKIGDGSNWLGMQLMLIRDELRPVPFDRAWTRFLINNCGLDLGSGDMGPAGAGLWMEAVRQATRALRACL